MCRILILLVVLFSCTSCAIWPISWEFNDEKRFLGPLISYQSKNDSNHFTFRPLLATYDSDEGGVYNFLYPFGHARKDHSYFIPFYRSKQFDEDSDTSFALFFWGKSKKQGSYGGAFPFYGKLYDRFAKDEIRFFMWPLYGFTKADNTTKTNIIWPIFSLYDGAETGFKAFPLYGEKKLAGVKESRFFLWPVFISEQRNLDTDEPVESFFAFPFYLQATSRTMASYEVMWPLFSYMRSEDKREWGLFAKLFSVTEGKQKTGYSFFPFVSYEKNDRDIRFNLFGPVYRESEWYVRDERFFQRRVAVINRYIEEKDKTFLNVWPLFEYSSEKEDYNFLFPSLLPFRIEGFNRIIKPLYTLYERRKEGEKNMVSFLYGLYIMEDNGEYWRTRFAFLFAMKKDKGKIGFEILSGLFGLDDDHVKIFFIPIKRGSPQKESTAVSSLVFVESCCTQQERY
jgi:hypothetical protein